MADRKYHRHYPVALRLVLSGVLIAQGFPAAQAVAEPDRPAIRQMAPSGPGIDGDRDPVRNAQFSVPELPPMIAPRQGGTQGSMGGGMTMVLTGQTTLEWMAGACTAGLFIGGVAAATATGPVAPVSTSLIVNSAAIGCGFAIAATAAGIAGMLGWRTVYDRFK